jgi:translocation and assembly module TamB
MVSQTSGADAAQAQRFRQRLPFLVYLNVDGEMMSPELSFNIDMPEDDRGAIGGQVYSRVQQVNQQEEERNRQVFSLLVLNRFFPEAGSDGSGGGTTGIARDNLNQALSDQLNALSGKLLGKTGIELDLNLDSFTDYQGGAPQDRTQLDITAQKKLFDDRLILSVGSEVDIEGSNPEGEASPVIGNVSVEYLLTEDGKFRLRGFRRNQYENVIDGQLIVNGIALIFSKEFNKFNELWRREAENIQNQKVTETPEKEEKEDE